MAKNDYLMGNKDLIKSYKMVPTAERFHADDSFVRGIMGPIGSGKSVAMCMEIFQRSIKQLPVNGVRKSRWAVIRNTFGELKTTTIKTWQEWFPERICPITFGSPIWGRMPFAVGDGTDVDLEIFFFPLDAPKDVGKLLSLELTGAWLNEAREIPKSALDALTGRVGRYPKKGNWSGIIMDTNPPDDDHWWYKVSEEEKPKGWKFFRQPPAIKKLGDIYVGNPEAENVCNIEIGHEYWLRQVPGKKQEWIKVYLEGQYGHISNGRSVWPEYNDAYHFSEKDIEPLRGLPLILGVDFGLTPAAVFLQQKPDGNIIVLDELVSEGMGIRQFAKTLLKPKLNTEYTHMEVVAFCDPAGKQKAQTDEKTCVQELEAAGVPTVAAKTNVFMARRESVAGYLTRMFDGRPGLILSPRCKVLRKALNGGYVFERVQVAGEERYKDMPCKNKFSHIADALQYGVMGIEGNMINGVGGTGRLFAQNSAKKIEIQSSLGWT